MKELIRAVTSRLPLRGFPVLFDPISPVFFRAPALAHLYMGEMDLELDLSSRVMRTMYFGIFEKDLLEYMRSVLRQGDTFVDVGANIGYISAFARHLVGEQGSVYSFEPVPEYAAVLQTAVRAGGVTNVNMECLAVGDREGVVPIKISGRENIGWNTIVPGFMTECAGVRTIEVRMRTLSDYFEDHGIANVRLIKIDTEGAELLVLKGLTPWLARGRRPHIVTEVCPQALRLLDSSTTELFGLMESYGYSGFAFSRRGFRKMFAGFMRLDPITPQEIVSTTDIVWETR